MGQRSITWIMVGAVFAVVALPVLIVLGVLAGTRGGDDPTAARMTTMTTAAPVPTTEAPVEDRLAALEASGNARTMVEAHQAMMDQRVNATPQMLQLMK